MMKKLQTLWGIKKHGTPDLTILLAAQNPDTDVIGILSGTDHLQFKEAFTTRGLLQNLQGVHLIITGDLLPSYDVHEDMLERTLQQSGLPVVSQSEFLNDPHEWLDRARLSNTKEITYLPTRQINITSWTGGVGKTTLAMAVCKRFAQKTGLPTALVEISLGPSTLRAIIHEPMFTLFHVFCNLEIPTQWENVSLLPMDAGEFEAFWREDALPLLTFISDLRTKYTLVVIDIHPAHKMFLELEPFENDVINMIVTDPRDVSLYHARYLSNMFPGNKHLIMNKSKKLVDHMESGVSIVLPFKENWAVNLDARLADPVLELVYPNWKKER